MPAIVGLLSLLLLTGCATRLTQPGEALHIEPGEVRSVREEVKREEVRLVWREMHDSRLVLDVVPGDAALPSPLAVPHASGLSSLRLRFPYDAGGVGLALLGGQTPLTVESAVVEAVWLPDAGSTRLFPVARLRLEGPLSLQRWIDPVRDVPEDPAPYRDLLNDVKDSDFRFKLARGVARVMRLNFGGDVPSTWELAAVGRDGEEVTDWQDRARIALTKGRVDALEGCVAIVRENAWGARRGKHCHRLPLLHILLASEVEGTSRRWSWSGLAVLAPERPRSDVPPLPGPLPQVSLRLRTLRDREYRHGPSAFAHGVMSAAAYLGALFVEYGLEWPGDRDHWAKWWDDWHTGGQGKASGRQRSRAP